MKAISLLLLLCMVVSCQESTAKKNETLKIGQKEVAIQSPLEESIARGEEVYNDFCKQCHLPNGKGVKNIYPPLANSDWLKEKRKESIHAVKYGLQGEIEVNGQTYSNIMMPMGLEDQEVADVMNYTMNSWGNTQERMVTKEEVAGVEK
ncbi:cytochrome c [Gangjinia marincola]